MSGVAADDPFFPFFLPFFFFCLPPPEEPASFFLQLETGIFAVAGSLSISELTGKMKNVVSLQMRTAELYLVLVCFGTDERGSANIIANFRSSAEILVLERQTRSQEANQHQDNDNLMSH